MPAVRIRPRKLFLLLLALGLFLPLLGRRDIVTSHEARVAQTAREMAASGWPWAARPVETPPAGLVRDELGVMEVVARYDLPPMRVNPWVTPLLGGELRLKKPPLPYWCAALLFKLAGGEREWLARLVPALMGALATLLVYDLARWTIGRRAGWPAALVWLSTQFIFEEYRKSMPDPYLAFFTLLCAWAWVRASRRSEDGRWKMEDGGRRRSPARSSSILNPLSSILVFYFSLALGFLGKGPMLLIPLAVFIAAYHAFYRKRIPGGVGAHLLGLLVLAAVTLPWPLAVWRAMPEAPRLWWYESAGGLTDVMDNDREWYYYLMTLSQLPLPWTALLFVAMALPFMRRRTPAAARPGSRGFPINAARPAADAAITPALAANVNASAGKRSRFRRWLFPTVWLLGDVLLFSLSRQKKNAYLLPIAPAIALAVAQALVWIQARARLRKLAGLPGALISIQTAVAVGFVGVVVFLFRTSPHPVPMPAGLRWSYLLFPLPLAALAIVPIWQTSRPRVWLRSVTIAYVASLFVFSNFPLTDRENARSPKPFARAAGPILAAPGANVLPAVPPEAAYYLPLRLRFDPAAPEAYVVLDDQRRLSAGGVPFFEKRIGRRVASVEQVVDGLPKDPRWHLFHVRLAPLVASSK